MSCQDTYHGVRCTRPGGHDGPHMAIRGTGRPLRWEREGDAVGAQEERSDRVSSEGMLAQAQDTLRVLSGEQDEGHAVRGDLAVLDTLVIRAYELGWAHGMERLRADLRALLGVEQRQGAGIVSGTIDNDKGGS